MGSSAKPVDQLREWSGPWARGEDTAQDFPRALELALEVPNWPIRITALKLALEIPAALTAFPRRPKSRADLIRQSLQDSHPSIRQTAVAELLRHTDEFPDFEEQLHFSIAGGDIPIHDRPLIGQHLSPAQRALLITTFWQRHDSIWKAFGDVQTLAHIIGMNEVSPVIRWRAGVELRELDSTRANQLASACLTR